jgi:hypothetical protein
MCLYIKRLEIRKYFKKIELRLDSVGKSGVLWEKVERDDEKK